MVSFAASQNAVASDDDEDEEPQLLPGLVARYDAGGATCSRRDDAVQFVWNNESPDERLPAGGFSVRWQGQLQVLAPGKHRFYLYAVGNVGLHVNGKKLIAVQSNTPRWFESSPVELEFGYQPLTIEFEKTSEPARIGLYWSGPQFELEPVSARLLFHEPTDDPGDAFERGAELWRALRCANCHRDADETGLGAPSLARLAGNLSRAWLLAWLADHEKQPAARRMPQFGLVANEAQAIADFMLDGEPAKAGSKAPTGDPERGRGLFLSLGCLACHQVGELGALDLFGGGDLSQIADKRPAGFFAAWLRDPAALNADHRMPVFRLTDAERDNLAAWLATLHAEQPSQSQRSTKRDANLGKRLVESLRCGSCHALPDRSGIVTKAPSAGEIHAVAADRDWQRTCLGPAERRTSRPGYDLPAPQREALIAYLTGRQGDVPSSQPSSAKGASRLDGRFVLRERNCLACHARDRAEGIAPTLAALAEHEAEFAPLLPLLAPPALTGVGDKLHDAALADAITIRDPPLRPWLAVRMPRFNLSDAELAALSEHFTAIDRIPERAKKETNQNEKALAAAGGRLVTSAGFGCTSCHQIGHSMPTNVALAAHGTNLSLVGRRIRHSWFDRWVRNPARIVPRMEMPAIQIPARGVLGEKLDAQLAAVWQVLNTPSFEPPPTGPIRVARHPGDESPPVVITDVIEMDKRLIVRPITIGLKNRHNMLFDLSGNRLVGWWLGDTANQRTRGKSWLWEPAGVNVLPSAAAGRPEVELIADDLTLSPVALAGTSLSELDWFETQGDSVAFAYRLKFDGPDGQIVAQVVERVSPAAAGLRREWQFTRIPAGYSARLHVASAMQRVGDDARSMQFAAGGDTFNVAIQSPADAVFRFEGKSTGCIEVTAGSQNTALRCELVYTTSASAPEATGGAAPLTSEVAAELGVVPGYEAARLPLPRSEMPTGLGWRDDGRLVFCSLKGGVWLARDNDGDGLEDRLSQVADGLPAPYGIACDGDAIDVAAKFGLVRLSQLDGQERARRADVVASGWGYTADYHDWTIGLPRDAAGCYYVGLPCQQDNRAPADAALRGTVVKLVPRQATDESPRLFDLEPLTSGFRFPMGLALDRDDELFVTDNQGNYTPFNELNHVRRGARFGFINKLDVKPGFQPPFEDPAIAIPHPWTRSVNGVCFLHSSASSKPDRFGPFEGHLIGCEFDTRRLIRMSLEKVGDTYQGAAYPFSVEPAPGEPTFEGPVVCSVSPGGDLYVGNLRDSGWGGGQNTGSIVRVRPHGLLPLGIDEVRALADGFSIIFTGPVDRGRASDVSSYSLVSYRRVVTPAYGGPDVDRESEAIGAVEVSADCRQVVLGLKRMRPGFVYEFQLKNLAGKDDPFFPAEAHYTLRVVP